MAAPTPATVEAEIDAVTVAQGFAALEAVANSITANMTASGTSPSSAIAGAVINAEDILAMLDPALIPLIGGIRKILPLLSNAMAMIEPATGSPWLGDPRLP